MSTVNQLSHSVRRSTASARSFVRSHEQDDEDTREYLRLIASLHEEWDQLESQACASVVPQRHLMDAIIAEARHGARDRSGPLQHVRVLAAGTDPTHRGPCARRARPAVLIRARSLR